MNHPRLLSVAGPLWVENILRTSLTTVDVLMLSFYSEQAVAAVGLVNQFVFFLQIMFMMVSSGAGILLSQYVGARQTEDARQTALGSLVLAGAFALVLSVVMALGSDLIIGFYQLDATVHLYAQQFLLVYASGSVFTAFGMLQGTILRTHGRNRSVMVVNMVGNVLNIAGNALVLFGPLGFPVLGVPGVAASTVFSQIVVCVILNVIIQRDPSTRLNYRGLFTVPREVYRKILSVGVPSAGENLSYNVAQLVNMKFISVFGTVAMAAYVYLFSVLRYVFVNTMTIGAAGGIKVGWWVGAGDTASATRATWRYYGLGLAVALTLVVGINLGQGWIFPLFTRNPEVLSLIGTLLLVSIALELGRTANLIVIPSLKGAGDINFPVLVGIVSMWGIGVLGGWLLGVVLGWGLVGVMMAVAADEGLRGMVMVWRWHSGRWKGRAFVGPDRPAADA